MLDMTNGSYYSLFMQYSREQLEGYIAKMEARLAQTASAWMKAEVRKGIELAKAELAKLTK